jgi:hypothetical protein
VRVDLVLTNVPTGRPIIAELKIANDKDPYTGLVQALAGASQLVSPAQRERLNHHHGPLPLHDDEPLIDVYVVLGAFPERGRDRFEQLRCAANLAVELGDDERINEHIGRLRILTLTRNTDGTAAASASLPTSA